MTFFPRIKGPVAPYSNVPIAPQNFQPSQFVITGIVFGTTTIFTLANSTNGVAPNYVVGQQVRVLIPALFGASQLNLQVGFILSLPTPNSVEVGINSVIADPFIAMPFVAGISGASNANPCVLTVNKIFPTGLSVTISGVVGMTQLNGNTYTIVKNYSNLNMAINVDSTLFGIYLSGGIATLTTNPTTLPQIVAMGDISSGQINTSVSMSSGTLIPGSFQNISP